MQLNRVESYAGSMLYRINVNMVKALKLFLKTAVQARVKGIKGNTQSDKKLSIFSL